MKNIIFIILSALVLCSCSTCKIAKQSAINEINFGTGGGFTGRVISYSLKSDGTLLKNDKQISKLSCDSLNSILELAEQLPKENLVYPDNTYSFIQIVWSDTTYNYTWSLGHPLDEKITELYIKLNKR